MGRRQAGGWNADIWPDEATSVDVPQRTPLALLVEATMEERGYTLGALARRSGLSQSTVGAYKTGQITGERSSRDRLTKLATGLGLPIEDVLEAAGASADASDEATLLKLFRRLPTATDRAQAVESLRVHVRFARQRPR